MIKLVCYYEVWTKLAHGMCKASSHSKEALEDGRVIVQTQRPPRKLPKVAFSNGWSSGGTLHWSYSSEHLSGTGSRGWWRGKTVATRTKDYVHPKPHFPWSMENPGVWTKMALELQVLQTGACRNKAMALSPGH